MGLLAVVACDTAIAPDSAVSVPVIQSLLLAGDSIQTAWVEWRIPADSQFGSDVRPVAEALVDLVLVLPDSSRVAFVAVAAQPGRFDAAVTVAAGGTYRLEGTVTGLGVAATTTVPGALDIQVPAADTIHIASGSCFTFCAQSYRWIAPGAATYLFMQRRATTRQLIRSGSTTDTAGVVQLLRTTSAPDTSELDVLALESHAAAFLLPTTPKSSISGVFGLFGAATLGTRWFVWE